MMKRGAITNIEAIVFDWGDTLVRVPGITTDPQAHFASVREFFEKEFISSALMGTSTWDWDVFQECYRTAALSLVRKSAQTGLEFDFETRLGLTIQMMDIQTRIDDGQLGRLAQKLSKTITEHCTLVEGALDVVCALKPYFKLGLLSNYPSSMVVRQTLKQFVDRRYFDTMVISADIGVVKPFKQSFNTVVNRLGVKPCNILFVGDDLTNDMLGAKNIGMKTAWLYQSGQSEEYEFVDIYLESILDLPNKLRNKS